MFDQLFPDRAPLPDSGTARWPRNVGATSFTVPNSKWHTRRCWRLPIYTLVAANALRLAERPGELITREEIKAAADRWASRRSPQRSLTNREFRVAPDSPVTPRDGSPSSAGFSQ